MKGKVLGIPLVFLILVLLILVPLGYGEILLMGKVNHLSNDLVHTMNQAVACSKPLQIEVVPTSTPVLSPTVVKRKVVIPSATNSGTVR